jgi:hypothetical protein
MVTCSIGSTIYRESHQNDGRAKSVQNIRSAVPRVIIDNDNFLIGMLLGQGGFNGLPYKTFLVVTGYHNTKP